MERSDGDPGLRFWLSERSSRVVLIDAHPEKISARNPHHGSHESFLTVEYAPERRLQYAAAGTTVWVGDLSQPDAVDAVLTAVRHAPRKTAT